MKTSTNVISFVLIAMLCASAMAQATDQSFATNTFSFDRNGFLDETLKEEGYYAHNMITHTVMPETLPANLDTNDIWGFETNGLQLSIRLRNTNYIAGDVVPVITIVRNLDPNPKTLLLTNSPSLFLSFLVRRGTGEYLHERIIPIIQQKEIYEPVPSSPYGFLNFSLSPRCQREVVQDLNKIFDLNQSGLYSVQAICRVYSPETKAPLFEVSSGITSFKIVEKPKPAAGN